jgi:tRNA pseudouridine55 synthase
VDGVLLIDKPEGLSSHSAVAAVRRALGDGRRRAGHAGTLDPFATGLLLVLVGRATRVQSLLMALPKRYEATARLGAVSSTGDPEGEITPTGRIPPDPPRLPSGQLRQRPPVYSAVKVAGERAYRRARRGEQFELAERTVTVHRFEQLWREGERAGFLVECGAGTYVRSLIAELGDAYCEQLRRTAIGPFSVEDAVAPPQPGGARWRAPLIPIERALSFLPRLRLEGEAARVAGHGVAVAADRGRWEPVGGPPAADPPADARASVLLVDERGALAVAEPRLGPGGPELKPVIGFRG